MGYIDQNSSVNSDLFSAFVLFAVQSYIGPFYDTSFAHYKQPILLQGFGGIIASGFLLHLGAKGIEMIKSHDKFLFLFFCL